MVNRGMVKKFSSLTKKKIKLDGPDGFQRYWHGKDLTPEMFSTCYSDEGSIIVWAAFSYRRTMPFQVVQDRQTAAGYVRMLPRSTLVTESFRLCGDGWHFQKNNAAIHNARQILTFL